MSEDLSRLPKWARHRIERLEADNASLRAKLEAGPEDSDTFADPYGEPPRPLGAGAHVRFGGLDSRKTFDVYIRDGELWIQVNDDGERPAVFPQSTNTIRVGLTEW